MDAPEATRQNWGVREKLLWAAIATFSAIYVAVVAFALIQDYGNVSTLLWVLVMVPSVVFAGALILWKRPKNRIGYWLSLGGLSMFLIPTVLEIPVIARFDSGGAESWMWLPMWLSMTLISFGIVMLTATIVTLPDGEFRHRRESSLVRWSWALLAFPTIVLISNEYVITHNQAFIGMDEIPSPIAIDALVPYGGSLSTLTSLGYLVFPVAIIFQVLRYRKAPTRERKQVRWVLYGGTVAILLGLVPTLLSTLGLIPQLTHGMIANAVFSAIPILLFPASIVVCVMEPKWVDVDFVIRRSFVYGALSFVILLLYVGVAAALGIAAGANLQIELAIFLTVLVAILFQPARRWLQRLADRWVFGDRPSKYEAVTEFGSSLGESSDPSQLLPMLSNTLQRTLDLDWVEVEIDDGVGAVAGGPPGAEPALVAPISDGVVQLGEIRCGPKRRGSIDDEERRLVSTLAGQVGLAISNARLAARLVTATEAERRRIERNIHDGAQQELVALVAQLGMAKARAGNGGVTADELAELQEEAKRILSDLRELAQGIHPSVLTDGGVLEAVEERCSNLPIDIHIDSSPGLRQERFADDVEGASYFFVTESLANVLKHSQASSAVVTLERDNGSLAIAVADDGRGFNDAALAGTGLSGLRDRISALGGHMRVRSGPDGTVVRATLPVQE